MSDAPRPPSEATPSSQPPAIQHDDGDILADEPTSAVSDFNGFFRRVEETLEEDLRKIYRGSSTLGALEAQEGWIPGRYTFKAIQSAAWSDKEIIRAMSMRLLKALLRSAYRLEAASLKGSAQLVAEIKAMKEASDATQQKMLSATWVMAGVTALASILGALMRT